MALFDRHRHQRQTARRPRDSMTGEASLYRIVATDDPAGPTGRLL